MLLLTRRVGQSVEIGDNIVVTILDISANQVRVGITAPKEVPVYRDELAQRIRTGTSHQHKPPLATAG